MNTTPPRTLTTAAMLVLSITLAGAQIYINPLDNKTGWDGPGGNAAFSSWTVDNSIVAPGSTASWKVDADFSSGTFVDVYTSGLGLYDFSTNTFSLWYRSTVTNAPLLWRLGTQSGPVYEVALNLGAANTWEQFFFTPNQFTADPNNLVDVNLIQLRFIGDNLGGGTAEFYVDQMNIVPEPSSLGLIALAAAGTGGLLWRKRRRNGQTR